jgi:hypothetical protein
MTQYYRQVASVWRHPLIRCQLIIIGLYRNHLLEGFCYFGNVLGETRRLTQLNNLTCMNYVSYFSYHRPVQSYWACFGLYPSSCMWKTKDHNVSETGSVSIFKWMGQDKPTQLGLLERASLNHCTQCAEMPLRNCFTLVYIQICCEKPLHLNR